MINFKKTILKKIVESYYKKEDYTFLRCDYKNIHFNKINVYFGSENNSINHFMYIEVGVLTCNIDLYLKEKELCIVDLQEKTFFEIQKLFDGVVKSVNSEVKRSSCSDALQNRPYRMLNPFFYCTQKEIKAHINHLIYLKQKYGDRLLSSNEFNYGFKNVIKSLSKAEYELDFIKLFNEYYSNSNTLKEFDYAPTEDVDKFNNYWQEIKNKVFRYFVNELYFICSGNRKSKFTEKYFENFDDFKVFEEKEIDLVLNIFNLFYDFSDFS